MLRVLLVISGFMLAYFQAPSAHASWEAYYAAAPRKILGKHTELSGGKVEWVAYYVENATVIALTNLDKPEMQALEKQFDEAFATGKKLLRAENRGSVHTRHTFQWYDVKDNSAAVTFLNISSGDPAFVRFVN